MKFNSIWEKFLTWLFCCVLVACIFGFLIVIIHMGVLFPIYFWIFMIGLVIWEKLTNI